MVSKKISELDAGSALAGTEQFPGELSGAGPYRFTANQIRDYLGRLKLTANATVYVNASTGNDTTGTGAVGAPWATIQKAISTVIGWDFGVQPTAGGGYHVTVNVAAGTYAENIAYYGPMPSQGGYIDLIGAAKATTIIQGNVYANASQLYLTNFTITGSVTSDFLADVDLHNIDFNVDASSACMYATRDGVINYMTGTCTVTGSAISSFFTADTGSIACNVPVTISGTPAIGLAWAFAYGPMALLSTFSGNTYSGSATGNKYTVSGGAEISNGGGAFPGSTGPTLTNGTYNKLRYGLATTNTATAFASLPASPTEGMLASVNNSTTATWGATITGGGSNHVLAYYNGTNWIVAAG